MGNSQYLSRGIDYVGDLGAKLRDLQGYRTLAYELIQNADDADGASWIRFHVGDEALIVDNDGRFSSCGNPASAPRECAWLGDGAHNHMCDFHRFRLVASGDKRLETGTTGAFGIGFIAVYQVTDLPELMSNGIHWRIDESRVEAERIQVCLGCAGCSDPTLPGTRFVLPWARDANSPLRRALGADAVGVGAPDALYAELERAIPAGALFLKNLDTIEVQRGNNPPAVFRRAVAEDGSIAISTCGLQDVVWHLVRGDFKGEAQQLRIRHPGRVESKRSSKVALAIPSSGSVDGILCACLPTEQTTGLPFHVNADFFPSSDRKRLLLAGDYQGEWNRAALRGAARALGGATADLPRRLGPEQFWTFLAAVHNVAESAEKSDGERTLASFWNAIAPHLRTDRVVYTTRGEWVPAGEAVLLLQQEEEEAIPVLESLNLNIVSSQLRPHANLLRSEPVGVPLLGVAHICRALQALGLRARTPTHALPAGLREAQARQTLWRELARLLARHRPGSKGGAEDESWLRQAVLAPGQDGDLWPCDQLRRADAKTVALFGSLGLEVRFAAEDNGFADLAQLCPVFDASAAIDALQGDHSKVSKAWQEKPQCLRELFSWLGGRSQEILEDRAARQKLAVTPLYPSAGRLRALREVSLPGDFDDPLGLAEVVDLQALGGCREFLRALGMAELSFLTYVGLRLPAALRGSLSPDRRRAAARLLAGRIREIKDDAAARSALTVTPLVECTDGKFRAAGDCYFDTEAVRSCLGEGAHLVAHTAELRSDLRELYVWLGVSEQPRFADVVSLCQRLAAAPYSPAGAQMAQRILAHLGARIASGAPADGLEPLRTLRWLPAQGHSDRWYSPTELYASYQRHLFESQAAFLDLSVGTQKAAQSLLDYLGVHPSPTVDLVVKHLLWCVDGQRPVNTDVYRFLNDRADHPSLVRLRERKCLCLADKYYSPHEVFWGDQAFGSYRLRLGRDFRAYSALLAKLGVRDVPDCTDALAVLREIADQFGASNDALDEEACTVLQACWEMLERSFEATKLSVDELQALGTIKCVPRADGVLVRPRTVFFESRAGLAAKFGEDIVRNVIPRPLGAAAAMRAAGVRELGAAVRRDLVECEGTAEESAVSSLIGARLGELGRVLSVQTSGAAAMEALGALRGLRCETATSLVVNYALQVGGREQQSAPEEVPAHLDIERGMLRFVSKNGMVPWAAIARELSMAVSSAADPGLLAVGFKEVLAAHTAAAAGETLDELGFACIDAFLWALPSSGETDVSALGIAGGDAESASSIGVEAVVTEPGEHHTVDTPREALAELLGRSIPQTGSARAEPATSHGGAQNGKYVEGRHTHGNGLRRANQRPVLRSYLPAPATPAADFGGQNEEGAVHGRSPVDEAGVRRVLEHETAQGRHPRELAHTHPGYDVESCDNSGKVVRYIEVKSLSGRWRSGYAEMSRSQFDEAGARGDAFWLYVVERAEEEDFRIYPIRNPALRANRFMFDDGWRVLAETAAPRGSEE